MTGTPHTGGHSLRDLFVEILTDGIISREEVDLLKTVIQLENGIDRTEAEILFELHTQTMREMNHPSWQTFFIEAICRFMFSEENGITSVTEEKSHWLLSKMDERLHGDSTLGLLLKRISYDATVIPESLRAVISSVTF